MPASSKKSNHRIDVQKTYKLFIGGKFPRTESGRSIALKDTRERVVANICQASRKDLRNAVTSARAALPAWSTASPFLRSQILYRMAEMVEGRKPQFEEELCICGSRPAAAAREVEASIDRLIYYAGWCDKIQQVFSSVNPVASSHFNFSILEPTGVTILFCPEKAPLLGVVSHLAPALCGGNSVIAVAAEDNPLPAVTFAEALATSDVPAGAVNILTGLQSELLPHAASHMDVNAVIYCGKDEKMIQELERTGAENMKRIIVRKDTSLRAPECDSPYRVLDTLEVKTTWHPVGA